MFRSPVAVFLVGVLATLAGGEEAKRGSAERKPEKAGESERQTPPQKMDRFVVAEESTMSFGLSVKVLKFTLTNKVMTFRIEDVEDGSDAAANGLTAGMAVVAIDGRPVTDFDATFKAGSDLRRVFIGRHEGDKVVLDIVSLGSTKPTRVTLIHHTRRMEVGAAAGEKGRHSRRDGNGSSFILEDPDGLWSRSMSADRTGAARK